VEPQHAQQSLPGFYDRLVREDPEDWGPAATAHTAGTMILYGADPSVILDEEDDVRALAVSAAMEIAFKMDKGRRQDLANKLGQVLSGE